MDYQEAIGYFERRLKLKEKEIPSENPYIKQADDKLADIYRTAISAMQELQEYKQLGTLEDLIKLKERELSGVELAKIACNLNLLEKYKQLGTPEEIREAVEKQKAKKPKGDLHSVPHYRCPNCNSTVKLYQNSVKDEICRWCGQVIDWGEEE